VLLACQMRTALLVLSVLAAALLLVGPITAAREATHISLSHGDEEGANVDLAVDVEDEGEEEDESEEAEADEVEDEGEDGDESDVEAEDEAGR
jgi:hypothetical protein